MLKASLNVSHFSSGDATDPCTQRRFCFSSATRHLHHNRLTGSLPREWSTLENLEEM